MGKISFRLEKELEARLIVRAANENTGLSDILRQAVQRYLEPPASPVQPEIPGLDTGQQIRVDQAAARRGLSSGTLLRLCLDHALDLIDHWLPAEGTLLSLQSRPKDSR